MTHSTYVLTPETQERITRAVDSLGREMTLLGEFAQSATAALVEFWRAAGFAFPAVRSIVPADDDYERLARRVAAGYNRAHPHRKLSWRRLNRRQRQEVAQLWWDEGQ